MVCGLGSFSCQACVRVRVPYCQPPTALLQDYCGKKADRSVSLHSHLQGLAPCHASESGERGLGLGKLDVGRPWWIVIAATAIPLNLLFASTLSGLLHALREAFLTQHHQPLANLSCSLPSLAAHLSSHTHPRSALLPFCHLRACPFVYWALQPLPVAHCSVYHL